MSSRRVRCVNHKRYVFFTSQPHVVKHETDNSICDSRLFEAVVIERLDRRQAIAQYFTWETNE